MKSHTHKATSNETTTPKTEKSYVEYKVSLRAIGIVNLFLKPIERTTLKNTCDSLLC